MSNPIYASDIDPEDVEWLAEDALGERIPRRMITVVAGKPDKGKGLFGVFVTAQVTALGMKVLYSAAEDDPALMTIPRLQAAGADRDAVLIPTTPLLFPDDLGKLETLVKLHDIDLVVLDPLAAHLGSGASRMSDSIRKVVGPLKEICERTGVTVIIVEHALKGGKNKSHPLDMIGGTGSGLVAAARAAYVWGVNPDSEDHRVLATAKYNLGQHPKAVSFEIDDVEDELTGKTQPFLVWEEELDGFDPMKVFVDHAPKPGTTGRPPDKRAAAAEWLTTYLAEAGGPVLSSTILEDAKQYGMSQKTLRRAAEDMEVVKSAKGGPNVTWDLPDDVKELMGLDVDADDEPADAAPDAPAPTDGEDGISLEDGLNALLGGEED